jgi:hypothetical protein
MPKSLFWHMGYGFATSGRVSSEHDHLIFQKILIRAGSLGSHTLPKISFRP